MTRTLHGPSRRWLPGAALICCGCAVWHREIASPDSVIRHRHPTVVRLTLSNGERPIVIHPVVVGDSIRAVRQVPGALAPESTRVALSGVMALETQRLNAGRAVRTTLTTAGAVLSILVILYSRVD